MNWLKTPQDFFVNTPTKWDIERYRLNEGDLIGGHYSHPSEPEDFSSGPVLIIRNATYKPKQDIDGMLVYKGNYTFAIGERLYRVEGQPMREDDIAGDGYLRLHEINEAKR